MLSLWNEIHKPRWYFRCQWFIQIPRSDKLLKCLSWTLKCLSSYKLHLKSTTKLLYLYLYLYLYKIHFSAFFKHSLTNFHITVRESKLCLKLPFWYLLICILYLLRPPLNLIIPTARNIQPINYSTPFQVGKLNQCISREVNFLASDISEAGPLALSWVLSSVACISYHSFPVYVFVFVFVFGI